MIAYHLGIEFTHFNSIKVRLKRFYLANRTVRSVEFQFHKGTIKTSLSSSLVFFPSDFNSIKVRLKPKYGECFEQEG